jgi:hypothetical protein
MTGFARHFAPPTRANCERDNNEQSFYFVYMTSDDQDDPDPMPCGAKMTYFIETALVLQCTYEMNKLNGVRLDLLVQKANFCMANVDLSATSPNVSIEGVQGFVPVEVTHAAACCCECPRGSVRDTSVMHAS